MKRFSVQYQILLFTMIPVLVIDVFLTTLNINKSLDQAQHQLQDKGAISARQIASASEYYLFSGDNEQIRHLLTQTVNDPDIIYAAVYNNQGERLAEASSQSDLETPGAMYFYSREPILSQVVETQDVFSPNEPDEARKTLGWVHLYVSKLQLQQTRSDILAEGIWVFAILLVLAFLLAAAISRRITRPVFNLLDYLNDIEKGELGKVIAQISPNEIGEVQRGFNSMSQSLLANRNELTERIDQATEELRDAVMSLEDRNRELALARDAAQDANRVKSQFLANMSHEIRTPIQGIKGFINLVRQTGLNPNQKRYVDIMQHSIEDLGSMINELLDFSKLESGKVTVSQHDFDLYDLLESTRDTLFTAAMEKDVDLHLIIYSDTPQHVVGDEYRIKQILRNLIGNAIKFTDSGFVSILVMLMDGDDTQAQLRFQVKDSGIGIPEEQQERLFQPFVQIDSTPNRRYAGTGLGLVISRNLARLMGGDIQLDSASGQGSTFTFDLPLALGSTPNDRHEQLESKSAFVFAGDPNCLTEVRSIMNRFGMDTEGQLLETPDKLDLYRSQVRQNIDYLDYIIFDVRHGELSPQTILQDLDLGDTQIIVMHYDQAMADPLLPDEYHFSSVINSGENIAQMLIWQNSQDRTQELEIVKPNSSAKLLVVDDNAMNLTLAGELCQLWGHQADLAANAQQAMALFNAHRYDLILLDLQMPDVDGVELMRMMRAAQPELTTPILSLTANVLDSEEILELTEQGFNDCLSKPLDEHILQRKLRQQRNMPHAPGPQSAAATISDAAQDAFASIDFTKTLRLSSGNPQLATNMLTMLSQSTPEFLQQLQAGMDSNSVPELSKVMHKLHGVTCYTGLPKLQNLLHQYDGYKHDDSVKALHIAEKISAELRTIQSELSEYTQ